MSHETARADARERMKLVELLLRRKGIAAPGAQAIPRREGAGPCALSFAQERLWFMDQLEPGSAAYNLNAALRLEGNLQLPVLERAFNEVVRRHESLRTTFAEAGGEPAQVVSPGLELRIPVVSLCEGPAEEREAGARRLGAEEFRRPFDLQRGPLLRVTLVRLSGREHIMLLAMHHIVSDGWSMGVLVREVTQLYRAFAAGLPSPLPELPIQYADFAVWQRGWLAGERLESQLAYWKQSLAGAPRVLALPTDFPRPAAQSFRGATLNLPLPASLRRDLEALGRQHDATLFMVLLAAFEVLLQRYTGEEHFLVGTDIANRHRGETEHLIGFFVNMLVLRADVSNSPTFRELLGRAREVALGAYAHQDLPLDKLVAELQPERSASHTPLFQVVFVLQNTPMPPLRMPGLEVSPVPNENETVRFDLSLLLAEDESGRLVGMWRFRTDLFRPETIRRMHRHYETLLGDAAARPDTRVSELRMLTEDELREGEARKRELKASSFRKFKTVRPKAVAPAELQLVEAGGLPGRAAPPLVFQPRLRGVELTAWAAQHRELIERELHRHGALLFRNFDLGGVGEVGRFARVFAPELMEYREPSTPRSEVRDKIYTSTEYPPEHAILPHNEMSYSDAWPMKVWFYCAQPPRAGGATPIADSRRVLALLDDEVRGRFAERQVMYVRNFGDGVGLPWQKVFGTEARAEVEAHCRRAGIEFEWRGGDRLRTRQVRQAVARHPRTGEQVWFNQAHVHHILSLDPSLRESLLAVAEDADYPLDINTFYGDGGPIEAEALEQIHAAYRQAEVAFPWQAGDILMVDNMLVAHGRAPFTGPRKIVVAMAEPYGVA